MLTGLLLAHCGDKAGTTPPPTLSDEDKRSAETMIADAKASAKAIDDARLAAVVGPPASTPGPSAALPCPVDGKKLLPEEPAPDATDNAKRAYSAQLLSATITVADVIALDGKRSSRRAGVSSLALEDALRSYEAKLKDGHLSASAANFMRDLKADIDKWHEGHDGVLVQKSRIEATLTKNDLVTQGRVVARFYLFSRAQRRIVCVADVDVDGPRGFIAFGENKFDLQANAQTQVPLRLTGEAVIAGLLAMRAAAE